MSIDNSTPATVGHCMGLPLPDNARLQLGVHGLAAEQFEALTSAALDAGLPVSSSRKNATQWADIGGPRRRMTVFAPENYSIGEQFDAIVERKLADKGFIEVPAEASDAR